MSYSGVQSAWQQAQNLINQQVQVLVQQLWEKDQELSRLQRLVAQYKDENTRLVNTPDQDTWAWCERRVHEESTKRFEAETLARKRLEFMKLKDRAKIKVEKVRDEALRRVEALEGIVELLRGAHEENRGLRAANQSQAEAFAVLQKDNGKLRKRNAELVEQVEGLQDVIKLGRKGIEAEWTRAQRGTQW